MCPIDRHDPAVDAVELVDQCFDPVVVQVQVVHQFNNLGAQLLILVLLFFEKLSSSFSVADIRLSCISDSLV